MTIGMCTVLTMAGTTVVAYSTSSARTSSRSSADQSAYALAEAGVNNAMSVLSEPSNNALDPYLLPPQTMTYAGGTVTYSGSLDESTATWTITATGLMRNPTGPGTSPVRRVLSVNVPVQGSFRQPLNNMAWNYIWAKATGSTCDMTIGQSVNVATPLFVEGNLCLQNTSTISNGPLVVKGALTLSQKANGVGQPSAPINEAHIGASCQYWNKAASYPCKGGPDNVYAKTLDATVPDLTPPTADWPAWYLNGSPGPYYPCVQQSGTPPIFDNDQGNPATPDPSKRNGSVLTVFDLTPGLSYSCTTAGGELSWNATTKVLTVKGTVYIDGSAVVDNGGTDTYDGQGSLYLSGTMLIKNTKLCAVADVVRQLRRLALGPEHEAARHCRRRARGPGSRRRLDPAGQRHLPGRALRNERDRERHDLGGDRADDREHRHPRTVGHDLLPDDQDRPQRDAVAAEDDLRPAGHADRLRRLAAQPPGQTRR